MLAVYKGTPCLAPYLRAVAPIVEAWLGWPPGLLDQTARTAICLHDTAKLAAGWSDAIGHYQARLGRPAARWMVHSDPPAPTQIAPPWHPPPHALGSAAASLGAGGWLNAAAAAGPAVRGSRASAERVMFAAIATHHAPSLGQFMLPQDQRVGAAGLAEAQRVLMKHGLLGGTLVLPPPDMPLEAHMVDSFLEQRRTMREWFAYAVVSRVLRLSDGWSQEPGRVDLLTQEGPGCCD